MEATEGALLELFEDFLVDGVVFVLSWRRGLFHGGLHSRLHSRLFGWIIEGVVVIIQQFHPITKAESGLGGWVSKVLDGRLKGGSPFPHIEIIVKTHVAATVNVEVGFKLASWNPLSLLGAVLVLTPVQSVVVEDLDFTLELAPTTEVADGFVGFDKGLVI